VWRNIAVEWLNRPLRYSNIGPQEYEAWSLIIVHYVSSRLCPILWYYTGISIVDPSSITINLSQYIRCTDPCIAYLYTLHRLYAARSLCAAQAGISYDGKRKCIKNGGQCFCITYGQDMSQSLRILYFFSWQMTTSHGRERLAENI
jgi:hypothetical protein